MNKNQCEKVKTSDGKVKSSVENFLLSYFSTLLFAFPPLVFTFPHWFNFISFSNTQKHITKYYFINCNFSKKD